MERELLYQGRGSMSKMTSIIRSEKIFFLPRSKHWLYEYLYVTMLHNNNKKLRLFIRKQSMIESYISIMIEHLKLFHLFIPQLKFSQHMWPRWIIENYFHGAHFFFCETHGSILYVWKELFSTKKNIYKHEHIFCDNMRQIFW